MNVECSKHPNCFQPCPLCMIDDLARTKASLAECKRNVDLYRRENEHLRKTNDNKFEFCKEVARLEKEALIERDKARGVITMSLGTVNAIIIELEKEDFDYSTVDQLLGVLARELASIIKDWDKK